MRIKPPMADMRVIAEVIAIIFLIIVIFLVIVICTREYIRYRTNNDESQSSNFETTNTSASGYPHATVMNEYEMHDNTGTDGSPPSRHAEAIYGQVVNTPNDDHNERLATSSSLVYADLEFVTMIMEDNHSITSDSDQGLETRTPSEGGE